jgi:hypothetical protein
VGNHIEGRAASEQKAETGEMQQWILAGLYENFLCGRSSSMTHMRRSENVVVELSVLWTAID